MRLIKQMVAALISVILGKENKTYELPLEDQYKSSEGLLRELLTMVNNGKINEAENLLYEKLEHGNKKDIESAILFYSYLNELDNVFCKTFLDKVAKHFWTLLHVQIGQSCKASASPE